MTMRALLAALLTGMALFSVSPLAQAEPIPATTCTNTVVDETTDHLFDVDRLAAAARDMGNRTGLDVYVRTFQNTPHGDAGVWWREAYKACSGWLFTDGVTPKPNILVVVVGMDRKSAIEYGEAVTKLDGSVDSIRGKVLGNALRDANAAPDDEKREAFTTAIEKTLAELEAEYTKPPVNWGNIWAWVLKVLLAIAGAVASVFGFFMSRTGIRKHREKVRLRAEVVAARDASTNAVMAAENTLRQHFIEADAAMEGVEGEFIALPSKESITKRVNVASAAHFERTGNPEPKSITALTDARDSYLGYADSIMGALEDAQKRTQDIRSRAEQCTDDAKDRDLRNAHSEGVHTRRTLTTESPWWADTTEASATLTASIESVEALVGTSAPRATVDSALEDMRWARAGAESTLSSARSAGKGLDTLRADAEKSLNTYSTNPPADVAPVTVETTKAALEALVAKIAASAKVLSESQTPVAVEHVTTQVATLRAELNAALAKATAEIAAAVKKRDDEKRRKDEEERRRRREREEREEEERRRRSTSFGTGFGAGYSSGGGFGGGSSGGGFGGGSSGSW